MGWKSKFLFLLIVYFAGFATAVYVLVPASASANYTYDKAADNTSFAVSRFKSDDFARSFRAGMDKCIRFGRRAAERAGIIIKEKFANLAKRRKWKLNK